MSKNLSRLIKRQPIIITRQLKKMKPSEHFTIVPKDPDSTDIYYVLLHPQGGFYSNQIHVLEFKTTYGCDEKYYFPFNPPSVKFLTDIYHTNISTSGSICLDILKENDKWSQQYTMETVMITLIALLDDPNTRSPYNSTPSNHWAKCRKKFEDALEQSAGWSGEKILALKEEIFQDYRNKADNYAKKNKLSYWAEYFPDQL